MVPGAVVDAVPPPVGSNPEGPSGIMPVPVAPTHEAAAPTPASPPEAAGEVDLAATNSPWSAEKRFEADVLPSANVLKSGAPEAAPAPPPPVETGSGGSRTLMTVILAVAAVGLVGAIVYFAVTKRSGDDDPASVNVGTEQREYADDPAPSATATAAPAPKPKPRPVFKPQPKAKKKASGDIYDDL